MLETKRIMVGLLLLVVGTGCGGSSIAVDSTVERPYDGPLQIDQKPNSGDVAKRAGAAALALECDGAAYDGGGGDYADGGLESVQADPRKALANFWGEAASSSDHPRDGYVVERADDDRVLFSYDVGRETKVAFIAADGIRDWNEDEGWGIESWAQCDPAELPADVTADLGIQVWERNGHRVPVSKITSFPGSDHCDWQDITFLTIGPYGDESPSFLRDTTVSWTTTCSTTFDARADLPADAEDTGLRARRPALWLARTTPRRTSSARRIDATSSAGRRRRRRSGAPDPWARQASISEMSRSTAGRHHPGHDEGPGSAMWRTPVLC